MPYKKIFILFISITLSLYTVAQEVPTTPSELNTPAQTTPAREKLQAYKIGYITHQLDLTPAEGEKFWPVFNQYQNEMTELFNKRKADIKSGTSSSASQLEYDQQALNIRKKYYEEFKKVLPPNKVTKLYKAEHDFKVHVIKQVAAHRNNIGGHHNPAPRPKPGIR